MIRVMGPRSWQALKRQVITLPNGIVLALVPFERHKGRHWQAWADATRTVLLGEWWTWQQSHYRRQPDRTYGRGGGKYYTEMVRRSWIVGLETVLATNDERTWFEFKAILNQLRGGDDHPSLIIWTEVDNSVGIEP